VSDTFSDSREYVGRARRYRLQLGLESGVAMRERRCGQTHDVSASGVLFEVGSEDSRALKVNETIEMTLMLPTGGGVVVARVICSGIARIVPDQPGGRTHVAATIDRHRLARIEPRIEPRM
jgi:hypothetical protein